MFQKAKIVVVISDIHAGSAVAAMPPKQYQFLNGNYTPNILQREMFREIVEAAEKIRMVRDMLRADYVIVLNGDMIEGANHHPGATQYVTPHIHEQEELAVEIIDSLLGVLGYDHRRDKLFLVDGTFSHVNESENRIATDLGAIPYDESRPTWPVLRINALGKRFWFAHHGPGPGRGPNSGNSLRNRLRDELFAAAMQGGQLPDYIVYSHYHTPRRVIYTEQYSGHQVIGVITPSFQAKTNYAYRAAPFDPTVVGLWYATVIEAGNKTSVSDNLVAIKVKRNDEGEVFV